VNEAAAPSGRLARFASGLRPRRFGLRARILIVFTLGAFALAAFLAAVTYGLTRSTLLRQRDDAAIDQAYANARRVAEDLRSNPTNLQPILADLPGTSQPVVWYRSAWASRNADFGPNSIPLQLREAVLAGTHARMIYNRVGERTLAVGVPIPESSAAYFEITSLDELTDTLRSVGVSAIGASAITTALGVAAGAWAARRATRPLGAAARAAQAIAGGRLDTRLEAVDDPDLKILADSFNDMVSTLQRRAEQDARFASDVSHELRSPLTTLSNSAQFLHSRRDELPERAAAAVDLLVADVSRFQSLVDDLLEISRFDAGAVKLTLDELELAEFVRQAVAASIDPSVNGSPSSNGGPVRVIVDPRAEHLVARLDKRRMLRVLVNLLENAQHYGAGDVTVEVTPSTPAGEPVADVQIAVEDHGPGVPPEERTHIFERFARGVSAGRRGAGEGAGLGLALVDEHVRLHGGRVWVADRDDGEEGARFVIELPVLAEEGVLAEEVE
jgi:two-component system, OmpR family, sensor histidine kinase MtrB